MNTKQEWSENIAARWVGWLKFDTGLLYLNHLDLNNAEESHTNCKKKETTKKPHFFPKWFSMEMINSLRPATVCIYTYIYANWVSLVQETACHLFGAKLLQAKMITQCYLDYLE